MRYAAAAALALTLLAGCATMPDQPMFDDGPAAAQGTLVAIDQPVWAGSVVATPKQIVEDSRCPENARCIHAGRLIVTTRIDGAGWRETVPLTLGEPHETHGLTVTLVSGLPEVRAGQPTPPGSYRLAYESSR